MSGVDKILCSYEMLEKLLVIQGVYKFFIFVLFLYCKCYVTWKFKDIQVVNP